MIEGWIRSFFRLQNGLQAYPREVMTFVKMDKPPLRTVVGNGEDFCRYTKVFNKDCYVGVHSNWQRENNVYDTVVFDIDDHENGLEGAYIKYQKVLEILKGTTLRCYCTGRGMHVYVDIEPLSFKDYGTTVTEWIDRLGLTDLVDVVVSKDIRRVVRVPYTINTKTGTWTVPIRIDDGLDEIKKMINIGTGHWNKEDNANNAGIRDKLKEIDGTKKRRGKGKIKGTGYLSERNDIEDFPPCVQQIMELAEDSGDIGYEQRGMLGTFLLKVWTIERVDKFFKLFCSHYDEGKTGYYLNYLAQKDYNQYGCNKLVNWGYCKYNGDEKKCAFSPNVGLLI